MPTELSNPDQAGTGGGSPQDGLERQIWVAAYVRALQAMQPADAEALADDAVQRYLGRWVSGSLPYVPLALRPFVMPRPEYEGLVVI